MLRRGGAALLLACLPLAAQTVALHEYAARRAALRKELPEAVVVLFGNKDLVETQVTWKQEPNFHYLTGWDEPGAVFVLTPTEEILFLPPRDLRRELYTGRKLGADDKDAPARTGVQRVAALQALETELLRATATAPKLYAPVGAPETAKLRTLLPMREVLNPAPELARLRMRKTPTELALLQSAIDATIAGHLAAWKRLASGLYEYQLASTATRTYLDRGCARDAYPPIVGSGPNSTILHYEQNARRMDRGEVVLMDIGAECGLYAADITRTVPVGGVFTPRQRELYDIVLGAQDAMLAAVKPGVRMGGFKQVEGLQKIAFDYLDSHGKDQHGKPLGQYLTHGIGHQVGLEVHDATEPGMPLAAGMVITLEPGVYLPEEGIGIRIEDMVLVTESGGKLLSGALPRDAASVERALAR